MNSVLVTGGTGQLGTELLRYGWPDGWEAVAPGRTALDLADPVGVARCVAEGHAGRPWAAIVNAAAYSAVDRAEQEVVTAWTVNALGPAALAEAAAKAAIPIVQVSTDYVFSGDKAGAWEVGDPVGPLSVYGSSKLGGELAVAGGAPRYVIARTAWLVSAHGTNFVKTMLRLAADHDELRVVDDQRGSPTGAADLAAALAHIAMRLAGDPGAPIGVFHFSNRGSASWADFAEAIFAGSRSRGGPHAKVTRIASADYPQAARRPTNSVLAHDAIVQAYGIAPRPWTEALEDILDELLGARN